MKKYYFLIVICLLYGLIDIYDYLFVGTNLLTSVSLGIANSIFLLLLPLMTMFYVENKTNSRLLGDFVGLAVFIGSCTLVYYLLNNLNSDQTFLNYLRPLILGWILLITRDILKHFRVDLFELKEPPTWNKNSKDS